MKRACIHPPGEMTFRNTGPNYYATAWSVHIITNGGPGAAAEALAAAVACSRAG